MSIKTPTTRPRYKISEFIYYDSNDQALIRLHWHYSTKQDFYQSYSALALMIAIILKQNVM